MKSFGRASKACLADSDIEIVAEASSGPEAVKLALEHKPDVVLLDIRMPDTTGWTRWTRSTASLPDTRVVMLSTYDNPTYVARAVALGASDYVLKGASRQELIATITHGRRRQVSLGHWRIAESRRGDEQKLRNGTPRKSR